MKPTFKVGLEFQIKNEETLGEWTDVYVHKNEQNGYYYLSYKGGGDVALFSTLVSLYYFVKRQHLHGYWQVREKPTEFSVSLEQVFEMYYGDTFRRQLESSFRDFDWLERRRRDGRSDTARAMEEEEGSRDESSRTDAPVEPSEG